MTFTKSFPRKITPNSAPVWEEIKLTQEEERHVEEECKRINFLILDESLREAKSLAIKNGLNTEENQVKLAIALFEKRASHQVFWKENKAKEKFDQKYG
ncbi:TPA: hypothetical protein HA278_08620 [Candidatus Woesearchaeota archaeon]|jgi:hypothetical protein|nr:hypothetical protein [archaeon]HIJ12095.1 hypothetical protein [Candidatus Woesearchaeota archaeon]|tara:strand:- start:733 stop:1029 length:297 start_codon:yes stop_codon:yes gene_type:complete